jgi:hypothetical protein
VDIDFDARKFQEFTDLELSKPLRSSKHESARNSHIFHAPELVFTDEQMNEIYPCVSDVIATLGMSWPDLVSDYKAFHESEKTSLGFS